MLYHAMRKLTNNSKRAFLAVTEGMIRGSAVANPFIFLCGYPRNHFVDPTKKSNFFSYIISMIKVKSFKNI